MSETRFTHLLNLYLEDNASAEERNELMQMIHEGSHDATVKDLIYSSLKNSDIVHDMDSAKAKKLLKEIVETVGEPAKVVPMRPVATTPIIRWVAAAAVILIAITTGVYVYQPDVFTNNQQLTTNNESIQPAVFTGKQFVRLPDGSTVILNEGSELSYSEKFGETVREVTLVGEGYFDVAHNPDKPFKVLTGKVTTTVLGTAFNVKAYPGEKEIKVTVTRGKVQVADDKRTLGIITPDQQISVNTTSEQFEQTNTKAETATVWKSQYLILDDVSIEEAVKTISEKYKVDIKLANSDLKKCRISATFLNGENFDQVLTVVSGVVQASFSKSSDGSVTLDGKGCQTNN